MHNILVTLFQLCRVCLSRVGRKILSSATFLPDHYYRTCFKGECKLIIGADAKALDRSSIMSVAALKGDDEMTNVLSPSVDTLMESMKGLDAQKAVIFPFI